MNLLEITKQSIKKLRASSNSPELDVQVLLCHALKKDKAWLLTHPEYKLILSQSAKIKQLIKRRILGEPVAYITGHQEFYGLDFLVNKNVLIPRPESEWLVEQASELIKLKVHKAESKLKILNSKLSILDMGTGSGCLIISLIHSLANLLTCSPTHFSFYASDISKTALTVAKQNAANLLFETCGRELNTKISSRLLASNNIRYFYSDLFSNPRLPKKFDLIIANLPYVPLYYLDPSPKARSERSFDNLKISPPSTGMSRSRNDSIKFEPTSAIFAEDNGAAIIKEFLSQTVNRLTPHGAIILELDPRNAKEIKKTAVKYFPGAIISIKNDLAGFNRYLMIQDTV